MMKQTRSRSFKFDVREWFKELDRFNAVEPFVVERDRNYSQKHESSDKRLGSASVGRNEK
jgi:hypothetical protein